jgi:hypothetical protein
MDPGFTNELAKVVGISLTIAFLVVFLVGFGLALLIFA